MKRFTITLAVTLVAMLLSTPKATADPNVSVERTSPNHTTIVIHDTSPEAYQLRNEQARAARRRLDEKRRRKHELELARLEAQTRQNEAEARARAQRQQQTVVYRKPEYRPAPFMNGGRPTMGISFSGVYGGYGLGGFGGYGYRGRGYRRSYSPRRYSYRGCRTRSYRPVRCSPVRSRPISRGYRGRRCR